MLMVSKRNGLVGLIQALLLVHFSQCQTNDADEFRAEVTAKCHDGSMIIRLTTAQPFFGILHVYDKEEECFTLGDMKLQTDFTVSLTDLERCGIQYNWEEERYWLVLTARQHRWIITDGDKIFNVSCTIGATMSRINDEQLSFKMALMEGDRRKRTAQLGNSYQLKIWSSNKVPFTVLECAAFCGQHQNISLTTNNRGQNLLFSEFFYEDNAAMAQLKSMFRFDHSKLVYLQCVVEYELEQKNGHNVSIRSANSTFDVNVSKSSKQVTLVSTMVSVMPPQRLSEGIINFNNCDGANYAQLAVCIILTIILAIQLFFNWSIVKKSSTSAVNSSTQSNYTGKSNRAPSSVFWSKNLVLTKEDNLDSGCDCCSLFDPPSGKINESVSLDGLRT